MKKKLFFAIFLLAFLATSTIILNAAPNISCPQGFVRVIKYVNVLINGISCQYRVDLCAECPAGTNQPTFTVKLVAFTPYPIDCMFNPSEAKDSIWNTISNPIWAYQNLSSVCNAGWGPCPNNIVTLTLNTPICWKKIKFKDDSNQTKVLYAACYEESCLCQKTKQICWNGVEFIVVTETNYTRNPEFCITQCESNPEIPDKQIPEPTEEEPHPESACFGLVGPCNK